MHWVTWQSWVWIPDVLISWSKPESHAIAHGFKSHCQSYWPQCQPRRVFSFALWNAEAVLEWVKEDMRRCLEKIVLFCFKCICSESLALIGRTWGQGSGVEKELDLIMNNTNETKSKFVSYLVIALAALSQSPLPLPTICPIDTCVPLVTRISKRKSMGIIVFT